MGALSPDAEAVSKGFAGFGTWLIVGRRASASRADLVSLRVDNRFGTPRNRRPPQDINYLDLRINFSYFSARMTNNMKDFQRLSDLLRGRSYLIERVRLPEADVAIEGIFEPPPLARLSAEDQVFVVAFLHSHGSIREMEQTFGVSYPTIKARLNRIAAALPLTETGADPRVEAGGGRSAVLDALDRGEISVAEALQRLGAPT